MTPDAMARLHATCFEVPRPWRADEFEQLLRNNTVLLSTHNYGFALGQIGGEDCELLTLAVDPRHRRCGIARQLVLDLMIQAQKRGAVHMVLEVGKPNTAALALYRALGFVQIGMRPKYYRAKDDARIDALILRRKL